MLGPAVEAGDGKEPSFSPAWDLQAARHCTREEQMWLACFSSSPTERGGNGAAAPPSIACQHCGTSEERGKFSAKKSALTQCTSFHRGLVPFHLFLLALTCVLVQSPARGLGGGAPVPSSVGFENAPRDVWYSRCESIFPGPAAGSVQGCFIPQVSAVLCSTNTIYPGELKRQWRQEDIR